MASSFSFNVTGRSLSQQLNSWSPFSTVSSLPDLNMVFNIQERSASQQILDLWNFTFSPSETTARSTRTSLTDLLAQQLSVDTDETHLSQRTKKLGIPSGNDDNTPLLRCEQAASPLFDVMKAASSSATSASPAAKDAESSIETFAGSTLQEPPHPHAERQNFQIVRSPTPHDWHTEERFCDYKHHALLWPIVANNGFLDRGNLVDYILVLEERESEHVPGTVRSMIYFTFDKSERSCTIHLLETNHQERRIACKVTLINAFSLLARQLGCQAIKIDATEKELSLYLMLGFKPALDIVSDEDWEQLSFWHKMRFTRLHILRSENKVLELVCRWDEAGLAFWTEQMEALLILPRVGNDLIDRPERISLNRLPFLPPAFAVPLSERDEIVHQILYSPNKMPPWQLLGVRNVRSIPFLRLEEDVDALPKTTEVDDHVYVANQVYEHFIQELTADLKSQGQTEVYVESEESLLLLEEIVLPSILKMGVWVRSGLNLPSDLALVEDFDNDGRDFANPIFQSNGFLRSSDKIESVLLVETLDCMAVGYLRYTMDLTQQICIIDQIQVDSPYKRQGYATLLLQSARLIAESKGCNHMLWRLTRSEMPLFVSSGFTLVEGGIADQIWNNLSFPQKVHLLLIILRIKEDQRQTLYMSCPLNSREWKTKLALALNPIYATKKSKQPVVSLDIAQLPRLPHDVRELPLFAENPELLEDFKEHFETHPHHLRDRTTRKRRDPSERFS